MIFPGGTTPSFFWSYWFSKNHNSSRGCDTGVVPMWSCLLFRGDHSRCVGGATPILFWEVADREHFSLVYVTQKHRHVQWWFYHHCVSPELGDPSWGGALCDLSDISWGNHSLIVLIILVFKNHNSPRGCDSGVVQMWSCLLFRGDHSRCVGGATPILFWEVADREHFSLVYVTQKPKHVHWWFYHHCVWFELGDPSWVGALCNLSDISWGNHSLIFLIILIKKIITLQGDVIEG